jgi:uncharacterized protein (TIGR04255 family)
LAPIYATLGPARASLRYLNRIAIPEGTDLREWFRITPPAPPGLSMVSAFQFGQTWDRIEGRDTLSATVRLVKITIDEPEIQKGNQGAMLDIEVFTRRGEKAPSYGALPEWFNAAHDVENAIFVHSITPQLADAFGRE